MPCKEQEARAKERGRQPTLRLSFKVNPASKALAVANVRRVRTESGEGEETVDASLPTVPYTLHP